MLGHKESLLDSSLLAQQRGLQRQPCLMPAVLPQQIAQDADPRLKVIQFFADRLADVHGLRLLQQLFPALEDDGNHLRVGGYAAANAALTIA